MYRYCIMDMLPWIFLALSYTPEAFAISDGILTGFTISVNSSAAQTDIYTTILHVRSSLECCQLCMQDLQCGAVSYNDAIGNCSKSKTINTMEVLNDWTIYTISSFSGLANCFQRSCYTFTPHQMNWTDSKAYCASDGGHLVDFTTSEEMDFVDTLAVAQAVSSPSMFYIGGSDNIDGQFRWSDGSLVSDMSNQRWASGQPDNTGTDNCMIMQNTTTTNYEWRDLLCTDMLLAICEHD